jgi:hypothetical protein
MSKELDEVQHRPESRHAFALFVSICPQCPGPLALD